MVAFKSTSLGMVATMSLLLLALPGWADEQGELEAARMRLQVEVAEAVENRFWIGLSVEPGEKGLAVESVAPDSPAAKAGLQPGDVITALRGKPINKYEDLATAVAESKGKPLPLQITRAGKSQRITVKPQTQAGGRFRVQEEKEEPKQPAAGDPSRLQPRLPRAGGADKPGVPATGWMRLRQPGAPGRPMQRGTPGISPQSQLPDDMEVTVIKKGHKPAVIKVKQGVKRWHTDETELGMLPAPAQAYAARLLGRPAMTPGMLPGAGSPLGGEGGVPFRIQLSPSDAGEGPQQPGRFRFELPKDDEQPKKPERKPDQPAAPRRSGLRLQSIPGGLELQFGDEEESESTSDKP